MVSCDAHFVVEFNVFVLRCGCLQVNGVDMPVYLERRPSVFTARHCNFGQRSRQADGISL